MTASKTLSPDQTRQLLLMLEQRFQENMHLHQEIDWPEIEKKLLSKPDKLWSLSEMENSGGQPDVVGYEAATDEYLFFDCVAETPAGRRSLCYDEQALNERKENKPAGSAQGMAENMGAALLTEADYLHLQQFGSFDAKTSSWLETPDDIRRLGGAIYGDYRFGRVFIYHNGAISYYAARGFRTKLFV